MQSKHYRLNKDLQANKILHDIKSMIDLQAKLNNSLEDTILSIYIKDISYTHGEGRLLEDDRKNDLPE